MGPRGSRRSKHRTVAASGSSWRSVVSLTTTANGGTTRCIDEPYPDTYFDFPIGTDLVRCSASELDGPSGWRAGRARCQPSREPASTRGPSGLGSSTFPSWPSATATTSSPGPPGGSVGLPHRPGAGGRHGHPGPPHRGGLVEPRSVRPWSGRGRHRRDRVGRQDHHQGPPGRLSGVDVPHRGQPGFLQQRAGPAPDAVQRPGHGAVGGPGDGGPEGGGHQAADRGGASRGGHRHQGGPGPSGVLR